ncbi:hypothetical protein QVD17_25234 [Tagetes erecta]|uniref:Uncharacterized protein n=1 Tax=Tagetes erecta TaxID=13708 RepID=A0AAD8NV77_TARER|nr:hypothetical protein QVD17_25234 [Tagetes erecta]
MDSYRLIDVIKVETANAIARYNRFKLMSKTFIAIEVLVAFALVSWLLNHLPTVYKLFDECFYACSCFVVNLNQHVVFLVGNVIVVVCYVLSGTNELENGSHVLDDNKQFEIVRVRSVRDRKIRNTSELSESDSSIEQPVEDEIVGSDNMNLKMKTDETDAETAIKQAVKQIERFRRTQSVKLNREISTKVGRELRRSVTERRRSVDAAAGDGEWKKVERLSDEEFKLVVEAFIYKQQSFLKKQSM